MKFAFFLFFLAFTAVSAVRVVDQNQQGTLACCPGSKSDATYFTDSQQCCFGVVVGVGTSDTFDCCGTDTLANGKSCCSKSDIPSSSDRQYDAATQLCCGGTILSQSSTSNLQCCGTSSFNPDTDLCCGTSVFRNSVAAGNVCCGNNAIYNPATDTCCTNLVTGAGTANRGALSGNNAANPKDQCCGTSAYSANTQFCCGSTISTIPTGSTSGDLACCGSTAYLTASKVCCGTTLTTPSTGKVPSDYDCCGSRAFVTADNQCCQSETSANVVSLSLTCCGATGFDPNTQLCCDGNSVKSSSNGQLSCCGSSTYNPNTQQCCIDKAVSSSQTCCGNTGYDPSRQTCCIKADGKAVVNSDSSPPVKTSCCTDGSSYDPNVSSCPCGRVISINNDLEQDPNAIPSCCDTRQYDANRDFCCRPTKVINETATETKDVVFFSGLRELAGFSCCFSDTDRSYNPGWQTCCDYKRRDSKRRIQDRTKVVCGTQCCKGAGTTAKPKGYFPGYQFCCSGTPKDYTNDFDQNVGNYFCCDEDLYDADFQACCGNEDIFDASTQLCCGADSA